jgi:uncharacterized protein YdaU (DUF1376 family)
MSGTIGHNRVAIGNDLRADLEDILSHDPDHLFIYAQWHIGDYIAGTVGMSLEHEGAYQRFLMRLYSRGKPLPDDDSVMAAIMSLSVRVWKRVKQALIEAGKIVVRAGCLTNKRFEQERLKRAEQMRKRSLAAQQRWQMERENAAEKPVSEAQVLPKPEPFSAKFSGSLPEVSPKLSENDGEKSNKNNGVWGKDAYANQNPLTKSTILTHARTREELEQLRVRLMEAGGNAVNEAYGGFLSLADPVRWIENGCDLEMDVVPAIRKAIAAKRTGRIVSWSYFTEAVLEARDRRLLPVAEPVARDAKPNIASNGHKPANPNFGFNGNYIGQTI